jgi:hypothetical protein
VVAQHNPHAFLPLRARTSFWRPPDGKVLLTLA